MSCFVKINLLWEPLQFTSDTVTGKVSENIRNYLQCVGGYDIHLETFDASKKGLKMNNQQRTEQVITNGEEEIAFSTVPGITVRERQLLVLMDQQEMVGDEVVDNVLQDRINGYNLLRQNSNRSFALVPTQASSLLSAFGSTILAQHEYDRGARHYFVPIVDFGHWYLVHLDMASLTATVYDSLRRSWSEGTRSRLRSVVI